MTSDATESIAYGRLMHRAMRGLIQTVLEDIADWLKDRYPEEMTIVVQNWFDDLRVDDEGFWITLNFGDSPEPLRVPFDAILTFVDPSVEFGLRFETQDGDDPDGGPSGHDGPDSPADEHGEEAHDAEVVRLDAFRKGH